MSPTGPLPFPGEGVGRIAVLPTGTEPNAARAAAGQGPGGPASRRFVDLALGAVADLVPPDPARSEGPEIGFLRRRLSGSSDPPEPLEFALRLARARPEASDEPLVRLGWELGLSDLELLAVALAAGVEEEPMIGRALAFVQAPVGGSRPTCGLIAAACASIAGGTPTAATLLNGPALRTGLLVALGEGAPLPERPLLVPTPLCLALAGHDASWPGARIGLEPGSGVPLPNSVRRRAVEQAVALLAPDAVGLLIRSASPGEGRTAAAVIAEAMELRPVFLEGDPGTGLGPWLRLRRLLPVFVHELAPGDRQVLPVIPGYTGPRLALAGPEGAVECRSGSLLSWTLPVPDAAERRDLWLHALAAGGPVSDETGALAGELARQHRHRAGRIAQLARLARHHAALAERPNPGALDLAAAAWTNEGTSLETLAEPLPTRVPEDALVVPGPLRAQLDLLILRCRHRDGLAGDLGPAAAVRYRPGVRALFTGPSGTGKTLAAGWVATRLGLPLYRVDLAGVTSKYIGETEKNLARLLAIAERDDVALLFDEADSLFGKRTDIRDSNDRFANAQTNYLLQRIESYDGIVILTSNSKARFDAAFARRLDFVVEFPLPGPEERRALWLAHLGPRHALAPGELNRLAALADLAGGHIRNAVLVAALLARTQGRRLLAADCLAGLDGEYRKLGKPRPAELMSLGEPGTR